MKSARTAATNLLGMAGVVLLALTLLLHLSRAVAPTIPDDGVRREAPARTSAPRQDGAPVQRTSSVSKADSDLCREQAKIPGHQAVSPLKPLGDPGYWIVSNDYPATAIKAAREGVTAVALRIGAEGLPERCTVTGSSGSADLDRAACTALMRSARFKPSQDLIGCPMPGLYRTRVRWQLPVD